MECTKGCGEAQNIHFPGSTGKRRNSHPFGKQQGLAKGSSWATSDKIHWKRRGTRRAGARGCGTATTGEAGQDRDGKAETNRPTTALRTEAGGDLGGTQEPEHTTGGSRPIGGIFWKVKGTELTPTHHTH